MSPLPRSDHAALPKPVDLLVMAAGMGSRFGGLKQLQGVGPHGELLLDYAVYDAWRAGIRRVVFVVRPELEADFRHQVGQRFERHLDVAYVHQAIPPGRHKPWGTGHAVLCAASAMPHPFITINADDHYGASTFGPLQAFLSAQGTADNAHAMVAFELRRTLSEHGTVARGICQVTPAGLLQEVAEFSALSAPEAGHEAAITHVALDGSVHQFTGKELVSMNCWGFQPGIFDALAAAFKPFVSQNHHNPAAEFQLPTAIDELIQRQAASVRVLQTPDRWFGLTYRDDRETCVQHLAALIHRGVYPERLWN